MIEYQAASQPFSSRVSYWQLLNAKPKYAVGDEVEILYSPRNPSRFILNSARVTTMISRQGIGEDPKNVS